jgi:hypothetical protein
VVEVADEIEPLEALHILLSAALPSEVVGRINSLVWFRWPDDATSPAQHKIAKRERDRLYDGVKSGTIASTGVFNGAGLRVDVDPADPRDASFDIAKRTLDCSVPGSGAKRIYHHLMLSRKDVEALARPTGQRGNCSAEAYRIHWGEVKPWPSDKEDDAWAKENGYSSGSVRTRRREYIASLPADQRDHIQKGGPRRPFPEPGRNL